MTIKMPQIMELAQRIECVIVEQRAIMSDKDICVSIRSANYFSWYMARKCKSELCVQSTTALLSVNDGSLTTSELIYPLPNC